MANETMLSLGLLGLGIYFAVLLVRGFAGYARFRRVRPTALLIWPVPRPYLLPWLVALGLVNVVLTILNGLMHRPVHHVVSLGLMALYFVLMVPLASRIQLGFYRDGVWADAGFLPWERIKRLAFRESPDIVLILLPREGSGSFRLPIPREEYGAVRKIIEDKIRTNVLRIESGILGL
jgi:hypothetical protein